MNDNTFPGFDYKAEELSAYGLLLDVFTISLMSGAILHFSTADTEAFKEWLDRCGVRDIGTASPASRATIVIKRRSGGRS